MDLIFELHLIDNSIFKVRGIEKISFNYKNIYFNFLEFFFSRKGIDKISRDFTQMIFVSQGWHSTTHHFCYFKFRVFLKNKYSLCGKMTALGLPAVGLSCHVTKDPSEQLQTNCRPSQCQLTEVNFLLYEYLKRY